MSDLVHAAVPEEERALAVAASPEAAVHAARVGALAGTDLAARVLAVHYDEPLSGESLARFPNLEAVVTRSDGFDHLPLDWMKAHEVAAYHLGDYAAEGVAQWTLGAALMLVRRVPEAAARTRAGSWARSGLVARDLRDVTVGVLGTGHIGGRFARLALAVGARVVGHDLAHDAALAKLDGFEYAASFDDLLSRSDVLSLHVPLTEATRGLVDAAALARLPEGAVLVNSARGAVVDQTAVAAALRSGRLAGYAADVLPGEPAPPDLARFAGFPQVVLTPHVAAYDARTLCERYARTTRIATAVLSGRSDDVAGWRVG